MSICRRNGGAKKGICLSIGKFTKKSVIISSNIYFMKVKEAMSVIEAGKEAPAESVSGEMALLSALHRLLDAPGRRLGVEDGGRVVGELTESGMLEALGRLIAPRDDSSVLRIECPASDFSASGIAQAVEGEDVHLVDMLTVPAEDGRVAVTLRVRSLDSDSVARSLERHGFSVTSRDNESRELELAFNRLLELQTILNI